MNLARGAINDILDSEFPWDLPPDGQDDGGDLINYRALFKWVKTRTFELGLSIGWNIKPHSSQSFKISIKNVTHLIKGFVHEGFWTTPAFPLLTNRSRRNEPSIPHSCILPIKI